MENFNKNLSQTEISEAPQPMSRRRYVAVLIFLAIILTAVIVGWRFLGQQTKEAIVQKTPKVVKEVLPSPTLPPIPTSKTLSNGGYHIFQSFNNCGPAALSMALRFYGINVSQAELGLALRPYQVPGGDNDDKSVTLEEVAEKSKEYGLTPYLRPMGSAELVKQFIANDIPVITRTWLKADDDIGHYRIIKGYDDSRGVFIQDDSLQGKDLVYSYDDYDDIWKKFNYEYLVLVPKDKQELAEAVIGEDVDEKIAWQKAVENSKKWMTIAAIAAVIIILAAAGGYFLMKNRATTTVETQNTGETVTTDEEASNSGSDALQNASSYKDGTYEATGTYSYHSGTEQVGVTVTLANGVIEDVEVETMAKAPTSKTMQADFAANYKPMVEGKNIDEVKLTKVSGSSLTPKGFNDALEQIKAEASQL